MPPGPLVSAGQLAAELAGPDPPTVLDCRWSLAGRGRPGPATTAGTCQERCSSTWTGTCPARPGARRRPARLGGRRPAPGPAATAAPPAGAVQVEGVSLVPTDAAFRASCRRAADRLGFAVPCPRLLPVPAAGSAPSELCRQESTCQSRMLWFPMEAFGSVVLRWSQRGTFVTLGLRGASEANRRLLLRLAGTLPLVPPG